jgi:DNA invertase Pin-like site-specific DNA recombinase
MMTDAGQIYCAYARQSLHKAGDRGDSVSVADQFRSMEEYAGRLGGAIVARFSDVDVSGGTESRDGLDKLLEAVKTLKPHAVLIRDVSRLARDTRIFLTLVDTLSRSGVKLLSATENLEDRTLTVVVSAFAERERHMLAGRIAGGVREHARRGKTHGRVPYGYRRVNGEMTIIDSEAAVVRQMYEWFAAGRSTPMIAEKLNSDPAMPRPQRAAFWRRDVVALMLRHRAYCGDVVIHARTDISGRQWPAVETRDAHPAIVSRDLWESANRQFQYQRVIVREKIVSPFAGFLWCANCGGRLYLFEHERHDRRTPRPPKMRRVARCGSYSRMQHLGPRHARPCGGTVGTREAAYVERVAVDAVHGLLSRVVAPGAIRAYAEAFASARPDNGAETASKRLADVTRRRARLLEAYESGALDLMTWTGRDRLLGAEADALTEIVNAAPVGPDVDRLLAVRAALVELPRDGIDYRALLTELGARIVVNLDDLSARMEVPGDFAAIFSAG